MTRKIHRDTSLFGKALKVWVAGAAVFSGMATGRSLTRAVDDWVPSPGTRQPLAPKSLAAAPTPVAPGPLKHSTAVAPTPFYSQLDLAGPESDACLPTEVMSPCFVSVDNPQPMPMHATKSIIGSLAWRQCALNTCGGFSRLYTDADVTLKYTLTSPEVTGRNMTTLDGSIQAEARKAFARVSSHINLRFVEVTEGPAHLVMGEGHDDLFDSLHLSAAAGVTVWESRNVSYIGLREGFGYTPFAMAHEIMHALGFVHPFEGYGLDGATLGGAPDENGFWNDQAATILSYTNDPHADLTSANVTSASLDFSAMAYRYKTAPGLAGDTTHTFNETFGFASIHDDLGNNTLTTGGSVAAYLSLRADGSTSTLGSSALLRLSVTSVFTRGSIRETGGTLQGNDFDNDLTGSAGDDVIETGAGNTNITTGGGADVIIVSAGAAQVRISDFDVKAAKLAFEGEPVVTLSPNSEAGSTLRAANGAVVHLAGAQGLTTPEQVITQRTALPRGPTPWAPCGFSATSGAGQAVFVAPCAEAPGPARDANG